MSKMDLFIDVAYDNLIKKDEELCGDRVEIIRLQDSTIIVLADGLGSGVKANILASLTAKIPRDEGHDSYFIKEFMKGNGKKIICGGTTSNIASRELGRELKVNLDFYDIDVPPTATMDGIDLITEGVLTLSKAIEKLSNYEANFAEQEDYCDLEGLDGASKLVKMLIENCTHFNLWVGKAINPAHQNPNFPIDLSIKLKLVDQLVENMKKLGKYVNVNYL